MIHTDYQSFFAGCTGTLLAPNLVLTARHCVSDTVDQPFACDGQGNVIGNGSGAGTVTTDFKTTDLYVFVGNKRPDFQSGKQVKADARGAKIIHDKSNNLCTHDVALIELDTQIPNATIAPIRLDSGAKQGEKMTAVGWGISLSAIYPSTRQQRTNIAIQKVGPYDGTSADDPPVPPNDFQVGESICQGDSGGPAFSVDTGAIIGVVSRGGNGTNPPADDPSAGCTQAINDYTEVSPFKDLILGAYQDVGQDPWLEGQPNPLLAKFGDACGADTDCQSNACVNGTCSQTCGNDGDPACPGGTACKADPNDSSRNVCVGDPAMRTTKSGCGCSVVGEESRAPGTSLLALFGAAAAIAVTASRRSRSRSRRDRTRSS